MINAGREESSALAFLPRKPDEIMLEMIEIGYFNDLIHYLKQHPELDFKESVYVPISHPYFDTYCKRTGWNITHMGTLIAYGLYRLNSASITNKDDLICEFIASFQNNNRFQIVTAGMLNANNRPTYVLHELCQSPALLIRVLPLLTPRERLDAFCLPGDENKQFYDLISDSPALITAVLNTFENEEDKQVAARRLLFAAATKPQSLALALACFSDQRSKLRAVKLARFQVVERNKIFGERSACAQSLVEEITNEDEKSRYTRIRRDTPLLRDLLFLFGEEPESMRQIFTLLPEHYRRKLVTQRSVELNSEDDGLPTVLHKAVASPDAVRMILQLYQPKDRLIAITKKQYCDYTVLSDAALHPASLRVMLELLPSDLDRQNAAECFLLSIRNTNYIDRVPADPALLASMQLMLEIYPIQDRLKIVTTNKTPYFRGPGNHNYSLITHAFRNATMLRVVLNSLPLDDRKSLIFHHREILTAIANNPALSEFKPLLAHFSHTRHWLFAEGHVMDAPTSAPQQTGMDRGFN